MLNKVNTGLFYAQLFTKDVKQRAKTFITSEKGSGEIIAMVLIIGVVLVLGIAFSNQIKEFFGDIWESLIGGNADEVDKIGEPLN